MNPATEIEALGGLTGEDYRHKRDTLLRARPDLNAAARQLDRGDWRVDVTTRILEGWTNHPATFRAVLDDLGRVDYEYERRTVVGISRIWTQFADRARHQYGEAILPLCWEMLLKFSEQLPEWKQMTFVRMIEAVPTETSIPVMLAYFDQAASPMMKQAAAQSLESLPAPTNRKALEARIAAGGDDVELLIEALDDLD